MRRTSEVGNCADSEELICKTVGVSEFKHSQQVT